MNMDVPVVRRCNNCSHSEMACSCARPCFCYPKEEGMCEECIDRFCKARTTLPFRWHFPLAEEEDQNLPGLADAY